MIWLWKLRLWLGFKMKVESYDCAKKMFDQAGRIYDQRGRIAYLEERLDDVAELAIHNSCALDEHDQAIAQAEIRALDAQERVEALEKVPREIKGGLSLLTIKVPPPKK